MSIGTITQRAKRACAVCGLTVEHEEHTVAGWHLHVFWIAEMHEAPCGLWCAGGALSGREAMNALRAHNVHGKKRHGGRKCPRCGDVNPKEPT
jgi:ribosomal protein S27AE